MVDATADAEIAGVGRPSRPPSEGQSRGRTAPLLVTHERLAFR